MDGGIHCNYFILEHGNIIETKNVSGKIDDQVAVLNNTKIFLRVHRSYIVNISQIKRAKKDKRDGGWLSFLDFDFSEISNPYVARFSTKNQNYNELKKRTSFSKI